MRFAVMSTASARFEAADRYQQKAWDMLTSTAAREAFDLDKEPMSIREALRLHAGVRPEGVQSLRLPGMESAHSSRSATG